MAGNQRQERKANEHKAGKGKVSLAEALGATQQHTVPVLPALDLSGTEQSHGMDAPATPMTAAAEATSPVLHRAPGQPGLVEPAKPPPPVRDPELTRSMAKAQIVLPDVIADSMSTEKTNHTPPAQKTGLVTMQKPGGLLVPEKETDAPAIFIRGARRLPRHHYARVVPRRSGSRPMLIQFFVAMMGVMALVSVIAAVSPLGRSFASDSFVEVNANSIPWVPTATPTPKPKPALVTNPPIVATLSTQAVINDIVAIFGAYSQGALAVANCESGYDPNAYNPYAIGYSHAEGVFQILYPSTWDTTSYANYSPYDGIVNIRAAYQIFSRDGYSWQEWACQP